MIERSRDLCGVLRRARGFNPALQQLHRAGGPDPTRKPPPESAIAALRLQLARCFDGMMPSDTLEHHPASPWRWAFFRALAEHFEDEDKEISFWLKQGAPMGLRVPITPGVISQ